MRVPWFILICLLGKLFLGVNCTLAADYSAKGDIDKTVWEHSLSDFEADAYAQAVEGIVQAYEKASDLSLEPGERKRVGLKIYTEAGVGLSTPPALVRAVADMLVKRGFNRSDLFIVGGKELKLREAGYLPIDPSSERQFDSIPVYALDTEEFYKDAWFYESNLPSREKLAQSIRNAQLSWEADPNERKSYLAAPLILEAEFWINLPVVSDDPAYGVNGVLANATLWNISNNLRFLGSPASASVAMAEVAGIPEIKERWVFSILSLQRYQYLGGPTFNALYTKSEKRLWLSANPIALDALMLKRINKARKKNSFPLITDEPPFFEYTEAIGYGPSSVKALKLYRAGKK